MRETKIYDRYKKSMLEMFPNAHIQRVETTMTGSGVPDVNVKLSKDSPEMWLETKLGLLTREGSIVFKGRFAQLSWMAKREAVGGLCSFLIGFPDRQDKKHIDISKRLWFLSRQVLKDEWLTHLDDRSFSAVIPKDRFISQARLINDPWL